TVRKIDPRNFNIAGRSTAREINRRIALNLVRVHQPLSRADLARRMKTTRGTVGVLIGELMEEGLIYEGGAGAAARGRKPVFLYVRTRDRLVVAADVRVSRVHLMVSDSAGRHVALALLDRLLDHVEVIARLAAQLRVNLKN